MSYEQRRIYSTVKFLDSEEIPNVEFFILPQPSISNGVIDCNIYKTHLHERIPEAIKKAYYPKITKSLVSYDYDLTEYNPVLLPDRDVIWNYDSNIVPFYNIIANKLSDIEEYYDDNVLGYDDIWAIWVKFQLQHTCFYL
jgi:hypothetical protein